VRKQLSASDGLRKRFRAVFVRTGKKVNYKGYSEDTILLHQVIDLDGHEVVTDHVWFTYSKAFEDAGIHEGDTLEFDARVKAYKKGYVNKQYKIDQQRSDYKLSHPTKIVVIARRS